MKFVRENKMLSAESIIPPEKGGVYVYRAVTER